MIHFDRVGKVLCQVGESPLWSPTEQMLHWVDIEGRQVHRSGLTTGEQARWALPERPACLALHADGGLVCALESSVVQLTLRDDGQSSIAPMATVQHPAEGMRFNDGRCDRHGAFWVTSMVMNMGLASPLGQLFRLDRQGLTVVDVPPLVVPELLSPELPELLWLPFEPLEEPPGGTPVQSPLQLPPPSLQLGLSVSPDEL